MSPAGPDPTAQRGLDLPRFESAVVGLLMLAATAIIGINALRSMTTPWPTIAAIVILALVGGWAVLAPGGRLPLAPTLAAIAAPSLLMFVVPWALSVRDADGLWFLGGSAVLLLLVGLRGRLGAAWAGMGLVSAVTLVWGASSAYGVVGTAGILVRQVAILVIGSLFIIAIGRLQAQLSSLAVEVARLTALEAVAAAAAEERRARLHWARSLSAPLLEAIAERDGFDAELRMQAALAEAELRDGLRAPSLAAEPVSSAARRARERGVEVVLLDDRAAPIGGAEGERLLGRIAAELDSVAAGRFVARLLPEGRTLLGTVLVDGPEERRLEL